MMVNTTPHTLRRAAPSADRQAHLGFSRWARVNAWTAAWLLGAALAVLQGPAVAAAAKPLALMQVYHSTLPGDRVQIQLKLSGPAPKPLSFSIDKPARIALDLVNTVSRLPSRTVSIGVGAARSVTAVEAGGRTRVVINLSNPVGYKTSVDGNSVYVTLEGGPVGEAKTPGTSHVGRNQVAAGTAGSIQSIGFHRGDEGQGRIIVKLSDPSISVDMQKRGNKVVVNFDNTSLPDRLERRLDVTDFATPVKTIDTYSDGNNVKMVIASTGKFDDIAYQTDNKFTVEVKPIVEATAETTGQAKKKKYTGQRLSLNFQNISVRAVLQLLADFTGLNMVTSDAVKGNLTLRLKNVPWDQALDIILKSRGLAMRRDGNVIMVAPAAEMAAQEKLEQQTKEEAPLENATIQINYAKAKDIAKLLKAKGNSLLSKRGSITVDDRTNKLLIQDTADNIQAMRSLVRQLDVPVRQVLIESRIVLATNSFSKELGVRFGVSKTNPAGGTATNQNGTTTSIAGTGNGAISGLSGVAPASPDNLNVDLPVTQLASTAGTIGLAVTKLPFGTLLELELSAAQAEGRTEIISSPRVITADQKQATIEQGAEIPYQQATSSGATSVAFKKAVLSLKVTPQITPDNRVIMDLKVNKDSPDFANAVNGVPPINTQNLTTQVLVNNGQTVVLGGVYQQTKTHQVNRVPFFGDLPIVGFLFRNKYVQDNKSELLIFITPKILKQGLHL